MKKNHLNPITLSSNPILAHQTLRKLFARIAKGELSAPRDKIPALPFTSRFGVGYHLFCFECFDFIAEALRHRVIKNRHDARFWGLKEKKAFCGNCLGKRLEEMPLRKRYLWEEYQKRGYWKIN